jgi:hypothetical protein
MWRRVDLVWTDVSKERIAYIFRVEKSRSEELAWEVASSFGSHSYRCENLKSYETLERYR